MTLSILAPSIATLSITTISIATLSITLKILLHSPEMAIIITRTRITTLSSDYRKAECRYAKCINVILICWVFWHHTSRINNWKFNTFYTQFTIYNLQFTIYNCKLTVFLYQWKGSNHKQSARWQHISQLKASAFYIW